MSSALFIGPCAYGPGLRVASPGSPPPRPRLVTTYDEFERVFGRPVAGTRSDPFIDGSYMAHAVRGFFANGGKQAYILRLRTGTPRTWEISDTDGTHVLTIEADSLPQTTLTLATNLVDVDIRKDSADVAEDVVASRRVPVDPVGSFRSGDRVILPAGAGERVVTAVSGGAVILDQPVDLNAEDTLKTADISLEPAVAGQAIRIPYSGDLPAGFFRGAVVELRNAKDAAGDPVEFWSVIDRIDAFGRAVFLVPNDTAAGTSIAVHDGTPQLRAHRFSLTVAVDGYAPPIQVRELSPVDTGPHYVGRRLAAISGTGTDQVPIEFNVRSTFAAGGPPIGNALVSTSAGTPDDPSSLTSLDYDTALGTLRDFDEAKLIVVPDAAADPDTSADIRAVVLAHCNAMRDRFAIFDADRGVHDRGALLDQVNGTRSNSGYAAFYYPWVEVPNPRRPRETMFVPPSGHIAGMFARVDSQRGVHKSPANEKLFGVFDVEARLGDQSQNPLHDAGVNVLRVFRDDASVNVFGGRTTAPSANTDFRYISVRRLFLFIEDALKRSLRQKLQEPNTQQLWKSLIRVIDEFLRRAQTAGAIYGREPEEGWWIQIDEGNNPASQRRLGILNIRLGIMPTYPAEYIVVEIGIWDGNVRIEEV